MNNPAPAPDRSEERFIGTCFVWRGEYPRRGLDGETAPEIARAGRRGMPKTNGESLVEQQGGEGKRGRPQKISGV